MEALYAELLLLPTFHGMFIQFQYAKLSGPVHNIHVIVNSSVPTQKWIYQRKRKYTTAVPKKWMVLPLYHLLFDFKIPTTNYLTVA
jgi:hypothetical protein